MLDYSVLMSLYKNEIAANFESSLQSILGQTLSPAQIVLVIDGPIGEDLKSVIDKYSSYLDTIWLEKNHGLGYALARGIKYCKYDYVARMDTDDIAIKTRIEKQVKFLNSQSDISVVGGYISEFKDFPQEAISIRKVPKDNLEIKKYSRTRNPLNHVTVLFKKKDVLSAGNYQPFTGFEDYFLWVRMLDQGYKFANIPEVMVNVRVGDGMIARRQGRVYFHRELKFQQYLLETGYIGFIGYLKNILTRGIVRLLPGKLLNKIYQEFARK